MPFAAVVTLIGVAIIVFFLAVALLRIILVLHEVSFNLGTVVACINAIGNQTEPVPPTIASVNKALTPVGVAVQSLGAQFGTGNGRIVELSR
jgi:hypothetical protein